MPDLDANEEVLDTSAGTGMDDDLDIRGEGQVVEDNGAKSSDAHDVGEGERSALDVVQDVVAKRDPDAADSSSEAKKEGEEADPKGTQAAKEPDDEKFSDVPFHKHPRFQQLLKQRDAFKDDAGRYRNVETFLRTHNVSAEEASNALTIAAQMKTDPVGAWKALKPMVQQLLVDAGEVLPQDLKARVDSGELSVEAAQEIAKAHASRTSIERSRDADKQRQENDRAIQHVERLRSAANDWDADRSAKDPNFEAKRPKILKELAWIHTTEGKATTPDEVKQQLERAYKAVGSVAVVKARSAPTVGSANRKAPTVIGSASKTPQADQPAGAMKFIKAVVAQRSGTV